MVSSDDVMKQAAEHLSKNDQVLAPVIARAGFSTIKPHREYYQAMVTEIIGQQLHTKAAASIRAKFVMMFGEKFPAPATILTKSIDELRTVGLSRAKANYIRDLAQHVVDGFVKFDHLDALSNDEVIAELTAVKGIGNWTAHMFLIFCMGRLDVLAVGDLGIRNGIMKLYGFDHAPTPDEITALSEKNHWHPYESVACWYIWQSLDNALKF